MKNASITKELLMYNNKSLDLYYSVNLDMYITNNFAILAGYCDVDNDIVIQDIDDSTSFLEDDVKQFLNMLIDYYDWNTIKIEHSENLTRLENEDSSVVLPYLYYKNILKPLNSDIKLKLSFKDYSFNNKAPLLIAIDEFVLGIIMPKEYLIEEKKEECIAKEDTQTNLKEIEENFIFDEIYHFYDENTIFKYKEYWGEIDSQGKVCFVIKAEGLDKINNYYAVKMYGKWGLYDSTLEGIIEPQYEKLDDSYFKEDLFIAKKNNKYGIINIRNEIITDFMYDEIYVFNMKKGYFRVSVNGAWGIINTYGKVVKNFVFDNIGIFGDMGSVKYKNKFGLIDEYGNCIKIDKDSLFASIERHQTVEMIKKMLNGVEL